MQLRKLILLLSAFFPFFLGVSSGASAFEAEYFARSTTSTWQKLIQDTLAQQLSDKSAPPRYHIESLSVGASPTVQINGINIEVENSDLAFRDANGLLQVVGRNNSFRLSADSISVNEVIERNVGGVIAQILVQASCKNVGVRFRDPSSLINFVVSPLVDEEWLRPKITAAQVTLGQPQVELNLDQCSGATGFERIIRDSLAKISQDPQGLAKLIQDRYVAQVSGLIEALGYRWTAPQTVLPGLTLDPQSLEINKFGGLDSRGIIKSNETTASNRFYALSNRRFENDSDQSFIAMPDEAVLAYIKDYLRQDRWHLDTKSSDFAGFQELMKSRWKQFFVWADLIFFSKKTVFPIRATQTSEPQLAWLTGPQPTIAYSGILSVGFWAPLEGRAVPYVDFAVPLRANLELSSDSLKKQVGVTAKNLALGLSYKWQNDFCVSARQNETCGFISKKRLQKALQGSLSDMPFNVDSAGLTGFGNISLGVRAFERDEQSKTIRMFLDVGSKIPSH